MNKLSKYVYISIYINDLILNKHLSCLKVEENGNIYSIFVTIIFPFTIINSRRTSLRVMYVRQCAKRCRRCANPGNGISISRLGSDLSAHPR